MHESDKYPHYGQICLPYPQLKGIFKFNNSEAVAQLVIKCQETFGTADYNMYLGILATRLYEYDKYIYFKENKYQKFGENFYQRNLFLNWVESAEEYKSRLDCSDYKQKFKTYMTICEAISHILAEINEMAYISEWVALVDNLIKFNGRVQAEDLFTLHGFCPVYIRNDGSKFNLFENRLKNKFNDLGLL